MPDKTETQSSDSRVSDVSSILIDLNRGNFMIECGRKLHELSEAVVETGSGGKMTITLEIKPSGRVKEGRVNQFEITPKVTLVKPEMPQGKSIFFVTEDCHLTRNDPDQMQMFRKD